jgi:hypothetical protein
VFDFHKLLRRNNEVKEHGAAASASSIVDLGITYLFILVLRALGEDDSSRSQTKRQMCLELPEQTCKC